MKDSFEGEHAFQLELKGLRHTLEWTHIQRERLLDQLDLLRLENQRLQDRIGDLERLVDELKQQERLF
jgi:regulator of replication initiation timing